MNLLEDGDVVAGFRPESLLPAAFVEGEKVPLRFRVTLLEYLGSERVLHGVVEGGRFDGRKVVSRIATARSTELGENTAHDFAVPAREVKFFEKGSGKRTGPRELSWR